MSSVGKRKVPRQKIARQLPSLMRVMRSKVHSLMQRAVNLVKVAKKGRTLDIAFPFDS
jgi:hypothetical protein